MWRALGASSCPSTGPISSASVYFGAWSFLLSIFFNFLWKKQSSKTWLFFVFLLNATDVGPHGRILRHAGLCWLLLTWRAASPPQLAFPLPLSRQRSLFSQEKSTDHRVQFRWPRAQPVPLTPWKSHSVLTGFPTHNHVALMSFSFFLLRETCKEMVPRPPRASPAPRGQAGPLSVATESPQGCSCALGTSTAPCSADIEGKWHQKSRRNFHRGFLRHFLALGVWRANFHVGAGTGWRRRRRRAERDFPFPHGVFHSGTNAVLGLLLSWFPKEQPGARALGVQEAGRSLSHGECAVFCRMLRNPG